MNDWLPSLRHGGSSSQRRRLRRQSQFRSINAGRHRQRRERPKAPLVVPLADAKNHLSGGTAQRKSAVTRGFGRERCSAGDLP